MTTYATMRTRIADEMIDAAITTSHINSAIKTAIKHWQRERFWFNTKVASFSTVVDQELYTSSDLADIPNIVTIDSAVISQSGLSKSLLRSIENNWIEEMQDGSVTGEPEKHSYYAGKIRLYPIPNAVFTVTLSYVYKLAELSADADTNAWVDECEEMIRQSSKRILCTDILHADDMAARYSSLEQAAYDRIKEENRLRSPQKALRADWPFNRPYYPSLSGAV